MADITINISATALQELFGKDFLAEFILKKLSPQTFVEQGQMTQAVAKPTVANAIADEPAKAVDPAPVVTADKKVKKESTPICLATRVRYHPLKGFFKAAEEVLSPTSSAYVLSRDAIHFVSGTLSVKAPSPKTAKTLIESRKEQYKALDTIYATVEAENLGRYWTPGTALGVFNYLVEHRNSINPTVSMVIEALRTLKGTRKLNTVADSVRDFANLLEVSVNEGKKIKNFATRYATVAHKVEASIAYALRLRLKTKLAA